MSDANLILAHDLGTSGNKATLYSSAGERIGSVTESYPTHFFNGCWAEQEPDDWWRAVCASTRQLLAETKVSPADVAVVALSGQMMGCTPVDAAGRALRPSMLYCDQRATAEADALLARLPLERFYRIVGHRVSASYTLEKFMWLRAHEPEVFAKTAKTLCAKDYVNFRLTGRMATDYSDASGTNAFDINTFTWSDEVLACADIPKDLFPEALPSTDILGGVTAEAAAATGLRAGTPVAVGGGDGSAAGVGVGCVRPGSAYNCMGSSSWIALTVKEPVVDPAMRTMNWAHCVPGYLHPSGTMQTAGSSFKWLAEQLCAEEADEAARTGVSKYALIDAKAASSPVGANGVLFLPYMLGERTPWWNPDARGAFIGLNLATRRADMLRAVLEGVSMNLGYIVDIFRAGGVSFEDGLRIIGGGAQSRVLRQILADACGCPVQTLESTAEATSMGAAIIGGVACGAFAGFDVVDDLLKTSETTRPVPANVSFYRGRTEVLVKAYESLVGVYGDLAAGK